MSKKLFTEKEVKILLKNKYIKNVSLKAITYSTEFKEKFIEEYSKGKLPKIIFEENGFDIDIIGFQRIKSSTKRWKKAYEKNGLQGLQDARKYTSGRTKNRNLTADEKIEKLEAKIKFLEVQNEFLKKLKKMRRGW